MRKGDNAMTSNMSKAVSEYSTFGDWFKANFDDERCERVHRYGFESGAAGLVSDSQTVPLYNAFANEIWDVVLGDCLTIQDYIASEPFKTASAFSTFMVWHAVYRHIMLRDKKPTDEEEET
jgi:hypothetical protein